jgi:hypothetical protein
LTFGIGGGVALLSSSNVEDRVGLAGDGLMILGVLLGVVFAAFALLIALMSDDYIKLLDKAEGGIIAFLRPFMIAVGMQVSAIFVTFVYRAGATDLDGKVEVGIFLAWAFLFAFVVADVLALTRSIMLHGVNRARLAHVPEDARVRSLRDKAQ